MRRQRTCCRGGLPQAVEPACDACADGRRWKANRLVALVLRGNWADTGLVHEAQDPIARLVRYDADVQDETSVSALIRRRPVGGLRRVGRRALGPLARRLKRWLRG
jgi:hypothetical protein